MAFDAVHDQADPAGVLRGVRAALAPGDIFLMIDVCASSNLEDNVGVPMSPLEEARFTEVKLFERVDPMNSVYVAR